MQLLDALRTGSRPLESLTLNEIDGIASALKSGSRVLTVDDAQVLGKIVCRLGQAEVDTSSEQYKAIMQALGEQLRPRTQASDPPRAQALPPPRAQALPPPPASRPAVSVTAPSPARGTVTPAKRPAPGVKPMMVKITCRTAVTR